MCRADDQQTSHSYLQSQVLNVFNTCLVMEAFKFHICRSSFSPIHITFYSVITKRLPCLVLSASVVWTELATSQDCLRLKISKQFCPVSKCGVNWVLSCPDPVSNSQRDVIFGNLVKTSSQMRSHRKQDWIKLFLSAQVSVSAVRTSH